MSVRHLRPQLLRVPRGLLRDVIRPPRRPHHHYVRVHAHQALGLQLLQDIQVSPFMNPPFPPLKGQCNEINNFLEGLKNQISTFCLSADGF